MGESVVRNPRFWVLTMAKLLLVFASVVVLFFDWTSWGKQTGLFFMGSTVYARQALCIILIALFLVNLPRIVRLIIWLAGSVILWYPLYEGLNKYLSFMFSYNIEFYPTFYVCMSVIVLSVLAEALVIWFEPKLLRGKS